MLKNRSKNFDIRIKVGSKKSAKKISLPPKMKGKTPRPSRINGPATR